MPASYLPIPVPSLLKRIIIINIGTVARCVNHFSNP